MSAPIVSSLSSIGLISLVMVVVALLETLIPLRARGTWGRRHLTPNLVLTAVTFGTNACFNVAVLWLVVWLESQGWGPLRWLAVPTLPATVLSVAALDLAFYLAHRSWHAVPSLWRFHAVHHSDPSVDVTTTIRQHPVEGVLRYLVMAVVVIAIGPSPAAFVLYRGASAVNGLFEHANVRAPRWLDDILSLVTTWPNMHKVHHSRRRDQTDTNYGNLLSLWDRLFGTFTPSRQGAAVAFGLDALDRPELQTVRALLAAPFRTVVSDPDAAHERSG